MKTLLCLMAAIVLAATPAFSYAQLRSYSCDFEDPHINYIRQQYR